MDNFIIGQEYTAISRSELRTTLVVDGKTMKAGVYRYENGQHTFLRGFSFDYSEIPSDPSIEMVDVLAKPTEEQ